MNQPLRMLVNGVVGQQVSVLDRGLHYGDGVFRTLRVAQGKPCNWPRQLARLSTDAERLALPLPLPDEELLSAQALEICAGANSAVLKIILTRGPGARGYRPTRGKPSVILMLFPMPDYPPADWQTGVRVRICETRLSRNPRLAGIKHLNRIEQVLARAEWDDDRIREGLMLDTEDKLIEGVSSNLFLVRDGVLMTPDLGRCGVAGLTREMILEAAPAYADAVEIRDLAIEDLLAADECLLCNSVVGIRPVSALDNHRWAVGPVTRALQRHSGMECPPSV